MVLNVSKNKYDQLITNFSSQLNKRGIKFKRLDTHLKHPLDELSEEQKIEHLEFLHSLIEQYEFLDPEQSKRDSSRAIVLHNAMVPTDSSIFEKIEENDYVEIIDIRSLAATYRCTETFKMTNYSVEELLTYSSLVLFDRPKWVITELLKLIDDIKKWPRLIDMSHFPTYILQETMSLVGDQYLITHKFVCPLTKMGDTMPSAILSTFKIRPCNTDDSGDIRIL